MNFRVDKFFGGTLETTARLLDTTFTRLGLKLDNVPESVRVFIDASAANVDYYLPNGTKYPNVTDYQIVRTDNNPGVTSIFVYDSAGGLVANVSPFEIASGNAVVTFIWVRATQLWTATPWASPV